MSRRLKLYLIYLKNYASTIKSPLLDCIAQSLSDRSGAPISVWLQKKLQKAFDFDLKQSIYQEKVFMFTGDTTVSIEDSFVILVLFFR